MRIAIPEPESVIVVQSTPEHPDNGEADMVRLRNGDLLLAYGQWDRGSDFNPAEIRYITPSDHGKTWGHARTVDDGSASAYASITPVDDRILVTYWSYESADPTVKLTSAGTTLKLKSIDHRWFYQNER